jgi:hypothetical protein
MAGLGKQWGGGGKSGGGCTWKQRPGAPDGVTLSEAQKIGSGMRQNEGRLHIVET